MNIISKIIVPSIVMILVSGCATKMSDVTEENAPTMRDIYDGTFNNVNHADSELESTNTDKENNNVKNGKREIKEGAVDLRDYTRTVNNEHKILFKRIKNPILVGYVYAHLTPDGIPIPSYSIPFRMSNRDYYAMPGEDQEF